MTDRNVFDALYFKQVNKSPVIDLTDDFEESDNEEIAFPDSFSSSVGKILNEKSISAVLSNVEVFYKSQIEYLEDDRYDKQFPISDNSILNNNNEDLQFSKLNEKNDESISSQLPSKQSFSSYYFIKQTFNCPTVLIDRLINTMSDIKLVDEDEEEIDAECPKRIEIEAAFEMDKSNIITKRDLRFLNYYQPPKPKKARSSNAGKSTKSKPVTPKNELLDIQINNPRSASFEIIEISDSDEENELVENSSFNEIQELAGY